MAYVQPRSSFALGYVQPNGQSSQRLSAGFYSLSARSNVPFVRLVGKSVDKTFTWGEIVEVPEGELCGVNNASWHAGDIFINGGCDYDNKPSRITVPVPFINGNIEPTSWGPAFPADVRTARRAYLSFDAFNDTLDEIVINVIGQRFDGSHNTANQLAGLFEGSGYLEIFDVAIGNAIDMIPLGKGSMLGDDSRPHTLLTTAYALIPNTVTLNITVTPNAYYTMEY